MPTNPSGVFTLPASTWVASGDTVLPEQHNPPFMEVEQGLTDRLMRDGRAPMTGSLKMGANRITGVGAPTAGTDAATKAYVDGRTGAVADGGGLTGGDGDPLSVDDTVLRTNIFQTRTQTLVFADDAMIALSGENSAFRGTNSNGDVKYQFQKPTGSNHLILHVWNNVFSDSHEFRFSGANGGRLEANYFMGDGSQLTGLNGSQVTSGTIPIARLPATLVQTSRTVTAGDGLTGGGNLAADRTLSVDSTVVRTSRSVVGGNGMTGGGDLSASRTITMGTPSSITSTSTNSVTANSHTHQLPESAVRNLIAQGAAGAVGTFGFLQAASGSSLNFGQTVSASLLTPSNGEGNPVGGSVAGTWRCLGFINAGGGGSRTTLFLRVA